MKTTNIPEYYQYEANRIDNEELVQGYYAVLPNYGNEEHIIQRTFCNTGIPINPDTLKRVAVKPIYNEDVVHKSAKCKNCNEDLTTLSWAGHKTPNININCCPKCGMSLDWSNQ